MTVQHPTLQRALAPWVEPARRATILNTAPICLGRMNGAKVFNSNDHMDLFSLEPGIRPYKSYLQPIPLAFLKWNYIRNQHPTLLSTIATMMSRAERYTDFIHLYEHQIVRRPLPNSFCQAAVKAVQFLHQLRQNISSLMTGTTRNLRMSPVSNS